MFSTLLGLFQISTCLLGGGGSHGQLAEPQREPEPEEVRLEPGA